VQRGFLLLSLIDAGARWRQSVIMKEAKNCAQLHLSVNQF